MKIILQRILRFLGLLGLQPMALLSLRFLPRFFKEIGVYKTLQEGSNKFPFSWKHIFPVLADYKDSAGVVRGHYFHQDLWAAKRIYAAGPETHIDIGSRIDGFIAHLLTFRNVTMVDVRPMSDTVKGLDFIQDDATKLEKFKDNSVESLSTLHAAEHFGLGRYGDPIDPNACFDFMSSLARVLAKGGQLYFSVPVGHERVEFNAQRVFAISTILEAFEGLKLVNFSYVDDSGLFHENVKIEDVPELNFGCGLFQFTK